MVERTQNRFSARQPKRCALCNALPDDKMFPEEGFIFVEVTRGFTEPIVHSGWFCSMEHYDVQRKIWREEDRKFMEDWMQDVSD